MDLTSSLEAKFGVRSDQVHKIRGKFGKFCHQKTQKLGKSSNFGVISEIQRAKFGDLSFIFLEAKFGAPTRISEAKFGAKPPRSPNMEVPPPLGLGPAKFHFYSKRKLAVSGGPSNQHRVFSKPCTWSFYIRGSSSKAKTFTLKISLFLPEHLRSLSRAVNFFQNSPQNCVNFWGFFPSFKPRITRLRNQSIYLDPKISTPPKLFDPKISDGLPRMYNVQVFPSPGLKGQPKYLKALLLSNKPPCPSPEKATCRENYCIAKLKLAIWLVTLRSVQSRMDPPPPKALWTSNLVTIKSYRVLKYKFARGVGRELLSTYSNTVHS